MHAADPEPPGSKPHLPPLEGWQQQIVLPERVLIQAAPDQRSHLRDLGVSILETLMQHGRQQGVDPLAAYNPVSQFHAVIAELNMLVRVMKADPRLATMAQALTEILGRALAVIDPPPTLDTQGFYALRYRPFALALMVDDKSLPGLLLMDGLIFRMLEHEPDPLEERTALAEDLRWLQTVSADHIAPRQNRSPELPEFQRHLCHLAGELAVRLEGVLEGLNRCQPSSGRNWGAHRRQP